MVNRNPSSLINKMAIEIIEKEVGRPIENIPKEQLLKTVENLRGADFNLRGVRNYDPKKMREKLTQLILEEKFNNFVREIRSQEIIKNSGKYQSNPSQVGMTNRTRTIYDIENDILSACQNGLKKTAIMYKCNLSHESLIRYLKFLLDLGLIEFYNIVHNYNINEIYKPTELGLDFIYVFQQLNKILNNQKADEPVKLDVISREISISKLYKNDRKKTFMDNMLLFYIRLLNLHVHGNLEKFL